MASTKTDRSSERDNLLSRQYQFLVIQVIDTIWQMQRFQQSCHQRSDLDQLGFL